MTQSLNEVRIDMQRLNSDNAEMWNQCGNTSMINTLILQKTNIPTKILKKKHVNHPWIKHDVKILIKRRDQKLRKLQKTVSEKLKEEI